MKKDWYAIQIKNGFENRVLRYLSQLRDKLKLDKRDIEFKVPVEEIVQFKDGQKKIRRKSLWPGYMLIGVSNGELTHKLRTSIVGLPYVTNFVSDRGRIKPLKQDEIDIIFSKSKRTEMPINEFKIGEEVVVTDGPFTEFVGNVSQVDNGQVIIDISIFGSITSIELGVMQVRSNIERQ